MVHDMIRRVPCYVNADILENIPHLCAGGTIAIAQPTEARDAIKRRFIIVGVVIPVNDAFDLSMLPDELRIALDHNVANLATGISTMYYEITKGKKP